MSGLESPGSADGPAGLTLVDYLRIARAYWKGIIASILLLTLLGFASTLIQPRIYASESTGIVVTGGAENLSLSLAGDNLAKSKAKNYKSVASSRLVADRVVNELGLSTSADDLLASVTVSVPVETAEVRVLAQSNDPATAQRIADAWVRALTDQVLDIESANLDPANPAAIPAVRIVPLGTAILPTDPISPNVKLSVMVGALSGLVLGLAYALVRNYLDRRLRSAQEIERRYGVPVIGTLPADPRLNGKSTVVDGGIAGLHNADKGSHAITEALRELRTNLQFIDVDNPPRIIVVTSSVPSEGKSTVTANLAVTMAAAGENVIVVDGDLRRPTVVDVFNLIPGVGVTDVLSGHAELKDVLQQWGEMPNLQVLGSGRIPPNPSELLGSRAMKNMLKTLAQDAIVLIDAPPLLPVTDAAVLSRVADGAIVVVRAGKTTSDELGRSLGNLERVKGHVLGTILNCVPMSGSDSYSYYGSYASFDNEPSADQASGEADFTRLIEDAGKTSKPRTYSPGRRRSAR